MQESYNIWNKWGKLRTVMLGQVYPTSFFDGIRNERIRSALVRITEETMEDLENFEGVLKQFGCRVLRPEIDPSESIMDYINDRGEVTSIPRSPLQPRDAQLVMGNKLFYTGTDHPSIRKKLDEYDHANVGSLFAESRSDLRLCQRLSEQKFKEMAGADWGKYRDYINDADYFDHIPDFVVNEFLRMRLPIFEAPSMTVVGKDVYLDLHQHPRNRDALLAFVDRKIQEDFRINYLRIGGHNDGCFHTLKPGAIITLRNIQNYKHTFPDWDVCYLENQSWDLVKGFLKIKDKVKGKWWVPGEEDNDEFTSFVEAWLQDWVGYVEETVFDVNVLMLDEHHVCVNNINPAVMSFLRKHGIEPVHVPWRHRYFWDGGLHCITLDLHREGGMEDYFPNRSKPISDYGYPD